MYIGLDARAMSRLDGVQEADNVGVRRVKLVPRSEGLESKKEEVPDDVLVVVVKLIEARHHAGDPELLLRVLEERDEGALAAVRQLAARHAHVEAVLPQHRVPVGADPAQASRGEANLNRGVPVVVQQVLVGSAGLCCGFQSIVRRVRGIS